MSNLYIPFCSFLLNIFMICLFFAKVKKFKGSENIYYFFMIIDCFLATCFCIGAIYLIYCELSDSVFVAIFNRLECYVVFNFATNILMYIYSCCYNLKRIKKVNYILNLITLILMLTLPISLDINRELNYMVVVGSPVIIANILSIIYLIVTILITIKNKSKLKEKIIPVIFIVLFLMMIAIIREIAPHFICIEFLLTLSVLIMYQTIENPDMKMLREIQQSKEFAEHANNEKAMFLYNTSQELKMPVKAIEQRCEELLKEQDIKEIINGIKDIKFVAKRLSSTISGTLDMPTTMASNIEIKVSKYSTKLLLKEMESISKLNMKDKNLEFRTSFDENIPEYLMGDSIRLKQIIATIMNNAIKHTEKGFIEFNVSSVIKHDICRLIITIEDSGAGIESSKLETLFYNTDEIDEEGILKADDTKQSLSVVKILTNLIGGTVIVNSELGKGSKFTVVLDQQIVEEKTSTDIAIEKLSSNKRILIVDDEEESLKQIAKLLNKYDVNVDAVLWGQDCLEKIRKKQKYDLILLDEDMPRLNGIKTFEKLKLEDDFNIPVVIMINEDHIAYKERYLYNGFSSCVVKPLKKQELDKVIKKHLKIDD